MLVAEDIINRFPIVKSIEKIKSAEKQNSDDLIQLLHISLLWLRYMFMGIQNEFAQFKKEEEIDIEIYNALTQVNNFLRIARDLTKSEPELNEVYNILNELIRINRRSQAYARNIFEGHLRRGISEQSKHFLGNIIKKENESSSR